MKEHIEAQLNKTKTLVMDFLWEDPVVYAQWLAQTYYFARETTRLLSLCAAYFPHQEEVFHNRFIDHTKEEQGHPEILLRDLKAMGKNITDFPEFAETASFYQMQYYWIMMKNPLSFFGYILFLEGIAARFGDQVYQRAVQAHGKVPCTFLTVHAHEDVEHMQSAYEVLQGLDETQAQQVFINFKYSQEIYLKILQRCQARGASVLQAA